MTTVWIFQILIMNINDDDDDEDDDVDDNILNIE